MKGVLLATFALSSFLQGAMSIDNFAPASNDRFANDPSFIANGFDLSGVGRTAGGRWATLIADNIFITANHFQPGLGSSLTFFETNDPTGISHSRTVSGGQRIGGVTDLYIGFLSAPLPTTIARYEFTTLDRTSGAAGFSVRQVSNEFLFTVGISPTTTTYGSSGLTNLAVGENRLEFFQDDVFISGINSTTDSFTTVENQAGDSGFTLETHESSLNGGDSGSPAFTIINGELVLLGIATAEGTGTLTTGGPNPISSSRNTSIYSYIGNYDEEIQTSINNNLIAIPEPSTGLLLALSSLLLLRPTRRV